MNRKIKFRCWDGKGYHYPANDGTTLEFQEKGRWFLMKMDKLVVNFTSGVLEQFTGLLDRNGKEIYEGDIITDYHGDKRVMVYADNGFWCVYPDGEKHLPTQEYREVIGNIHQSPQPPLLIS